MTQPASRHAGWLCSHVGIVLAWHLCWILSANFAEGLFLDNFWLADDPLRMAGHFTDLGVIRQLDGESPNVPIIHDSGQNAESPDSGAEVIA
jgi:hypothetical protein